ncbi:MAG: sigma-70 family RNA polymerase sigma factor [Clostridia bacterium]|nr:sigma-70 family RNA polymerase sigma factor [Clostridia bacterium]
MRYTDEEFNGIMNEYGDTVLRICFVRLGNLQDAEDTFQEVFISLYNAIKKPKNELLKPWLIRTACNKCVSFIRARKNTVPIYDDSACVTEEFDNTVQNAILSLEKNQRTAIYLFYYENLSTREIADALNTTEGNVRVLLHRSRARLKEILKEDYFE